MMELALTIALGILLAYAIIALLPLVSLLALVALGVVAFVVAVMLFVPAFEAVTGVNYGVAVGYAIPAYFLGWPIALLLWALAGRLTDMVRGK